MSTAADTQKSAIRWMPFQCPSCFGLFRAKREDAGELGRCPGCEARLLIPEPKKKSEKPLLEKDDQQGSEPASKKNYAVAEVVEQSEEENVPNDWENKPRKRKRFSGAQSDKIDWEEAETSEGSKSGVSWVMIISVIMIGALAVAGGVYFVKSKPSLGGGQVDDFVLQAESMVNENAARNESMTAAAAKEDDTARELVERFDAFDPGKIREVIQEFLSAPNIEAKSKFSRGGEELVEKMRDYYEEDVVPDEGFRSMDITKVVYRGNFISTFVRLDDFLDYPIVVERTSADNYLVDWESWVGYGEKKVDQLLLTKPTAPLLVRVVASKENYYNYSFSDDEKWLSLKLGFRNQERSLWAYVERASEAGKTFERYGANIKGRPLMIKIKYPSNARAKDQVIVTELICDGWLDMKTEEGE
ncbi:hypothetical protein N9291_01340 [bacterium]|nr:hypothetical protein [bacterium]